MKVLIISLNCKYVCHFIFDKMIESDKIIKYLIQLYLLSVWKNLNTQDKTDKPN